MIAHLSKVLQPPASNSRLHGFSVGTFGGAPDIQHWLNIRNAAFASQTAGSRPWTEADFHREFTHQPTWRREWMWFATAPDATAPIGTVAMTPAKRQGTPAASISWLAVLPEWQRRGVGRLLIAVLEAAAWEEGFREVAAETRSDWAPAMRFYRSLGYRPAARPNTCA
ncbi:MAG: GNAT family N-acetyltransferase [Planctomycetes bacterium]|nr:GNAT family N-acetyltransferase [Planctomycetota bacterium]